MCNIPHNNTRQQSALLNILLSGIHQCITKALFDYIQLTDFPIIKLTIPYMRYKIQEVEEVYKILERTYSKSQNLRQ